MKKMKKYFIGRVIAGALLIALVEPGIAEDFILNTHNCAGFVVSSLADTALGQAMSIFADEQLVNNLGLAIAAVRTIVIIRSQRHKQSRFFFCGRIGDKFPALSSVYLEVTWNF